MCLGHRELAEPHRRHHQSVEIVLWALVSPEVDQRLSAQETGPIRLQPGEWRSSDIAWIIHTIGEPKILGGLMEQLTKTVFKDRAPKIRVRGEDGKAKVGELHLKDTQLTKAVDAAMSAKANKRSGSVRSQSQGLNRRQLKVLALLGEGMSLSEIATEVGLTYKSVSNVCRRIKAKLAIPNNVALSYAVAEHLRGNDVEIS